MYNLSPPETASCNYKGQCTTFLGESSKWHLQWQFWQLLSSRKAHCFCQASGSFPLSVQSRQKKKKKSWNPPITHLWLMAVPLIKHRASETQQGRETRREDSCRLPRSLPVCPWGTGKLSRGRAKKQCSALSTLSYLQTPLCAGDWQRLCFPQPFRCGTSNMAHNMKGHIEQQSGVLRLLNPSPEDQCEMEPLHTTLIDDGPIK